LSVLSRARFYIKLVFRTTSELLRRCDSQVPEEPVMTEKLL